MWEIVTKVGAVSAIIVAGMLLWDRFKTTP